MFHRRPFLRSVAAAGFLLVLPVRAELAASSPFLPPAGQAQAAPTSNAPLELRGVMATGDTTMFSIFDTGKKNGTWVRLNESGYDFAVKKYDASNDTVTVEHQGRTHVLAMRTAKIASSGSAVPPAPSVAAPLNPVTRNVVANPTPASEAARLASWQAEIQRRRDMRAQQAAQGQAGAPGTPQAPPAPQQNAPGNRGQRQGNGQ